MTSSMQTGLFIGGEWTAAAGQGELEVIDPATEEPFAVVAAGTTEDGLQAVDAAHRALPGWAATPPRQRAEVLRRTFELMAERHQELAELIVRENGKALADAKAEVTYAAEFFRWNAEEAVRNVGAVTTAPSGANRIIVVHQPVGVCLMVTPWNFPAAMATRKLAPALAAGCTTVLKPASATPLTALAIAGILADAGAPPGTINVVTALKSGQLIDDLLHDDRVRKVSFTGSTEVGRTILKLAADNVVNTSMELGGNAPFVVLDDADLDAAIEGAMIAKMRNGGEACTSANRFLVHRRVADDFAQRLAAAMGKLRLGPGLDPDTDVGPLVDAPTRAKVGELVDDATGRGATVHTGGSAPDRTGFYYAPTVLSVSDPATELLREEIFGPVAPVVAFDSDDEAIAMANDTEFGLVAYLYTRDLGRGLRVSEAIEAGMVGLNRGLVSDPAAPFGGVKQSGIGREGGHDGLLDYLESKYIATNW